MKEYTQTRESYSKYLGKGECEVIKRASTVNVKALIVANQLRWVGHLVQRPITVFLEGSSTANSVGGSSKSGGPKTFLRGNTKLNHESPQTEREQLDTDC